MAGVQPRRAPCSSVQGDPGVSLSRVPWLALKAGGVLGGVAGFFNAATGSAAAGRPAPRRRHGSQPRVDEPVRRESFGVWVGEVDASFAGPRVRKRGKVRWRGLLRRGSGEILTSERASLTVPTGHPSPYSTIATARTGAASHPASLIGSPKKMNRLPTTSLRLIRASKIGRP